MLATAAPCGVVQRQARHLCDHTRRQRLFCAAACACRTYGRPRCRRSCHRPVSHARAMHRRRWVRCRRARRSWVRASHDNTSPPPMWRSTAPGLISNSSLAEQARPQRFTVLVVISRWVNTRSMPYCHRCKIWEEKKLGLEFEKLRMTAEGVIDGNPGVLMGSGAVSIQHPGETYLHHFELRKVRLKDCH